jgi:CRP-like cAMP-binding protein
MRACTTAEFSALRTIIDQISPIPDAEWQYASQFLVTEDFAGGSFLQRAGDNPQASFVIVEGAVRIYYLSRGGREYNQAFLCKGQIAASMRSVIGGIPSRFFIQAMRPTRAILLCSESVLKLYDRNDCWNRLGRVSAEGALIGLESRQAMTFEPLEERYRTFLNEYKDFPYRIPNYQIASYLGITDVALSRLRRRMNLV